MQVNSGIEDYLLNALSAFKFDVLSWGSHRGFSFLLPPHCWHLVHHFQSLSDGTQHQSRNPHRPPITWLWLLFSRKKTLVSEVILASCSWSLLHQFVTRPPITWLWLLSHHLNWLSGWGLGLLGSLPLSQGNTGCKNNVKMGMWNSFPFS